MKKTVDRRQALVSTAAALGLTMGLTATALASGQDFPPKQMTVVVPFPPGGPTDVLGRLVAQALAARLQINVIVENRPGASATIGSQQVVRSPADGSVLLFNATHHVTNPVYLKRVPYDTERDLAPIALVASIPSVLVVHPSTPAKTVAELVALSKREPGKLSMATFGGANQLAGELFKSMAGLDILNIPHSGQSPAVTAVIGGHVPMMFDTLSTVLPHITSGRLRPLAVTGASRTALLPEVPALAETPSLAGYEAIAWFGLFMPANGTVAETRLSQVMSEILASPEVQQRLRAQGAEPGSLTGSAFRQFVGQELKKWQAVGERAGIQKE